MNTTAALRIAGLAKRFPGPRKGLLRAPARQIHAVHSMDLTLPAGRTLGIVGESGCGKSTLARMLVGLLPPSEGRIEIEGQDMAGMSPRAFARRIQYVFQDPVGSLNPRKRVRQILEAPLRHLGGLEAADRARRLQEIFAAVNLRPEFLDRYPHEFSGGQAQRIGIARALAASPRIMVLDEPVSALDVSVQAQVLNLLGELRASAKLSYVFISHDLAVVEAVSDEVGVLYFGSLVERGDASAVFHRPRHPYTRLLAESAPAFDRPLPAMGVADLPDPLNPPAGCAFAARCPLAEARCRVEAPKLQGETHRVACHRPLH